MNEFTIFTDGDVDVPSPYDKEIAFLPQYYYFHEDTIYGDEQLLSREEFFEQLQGSRAYTAGVNPALVHSRFEEVLKKGNDILCITVSSGLSGSWSTICTTAEELREDYPERQIEVIDSLSASLGSGFLCVDALEMKQQGKSLQETATEIRERLKRIDLYFVVDDFKYLVQGGRVSPTVGKIGDILDIKVILTMRKGRIEPYRKNRGLNNALKNLHQIVAARKSTRLGAIYVGNQEMFDKCCSSLLYDSQVSLNLIVSSHVGPNTTGIAIEWADG